MEIRKCTNFDTYSVAKDPLLLLMDTIQTHQLVPTGDPWVYADIAMQAYHTIKQLRDETVNNCIRMEDKIRAIGRLGLEIPTPQQ